MTPGLRDTPSELRRAALALATLALVGFSIILACQTSWLNGPLRTLFAERNTLGERSRALLMVSLAAGLVAPALVGVFVLWYTRQVRFLERVATMTAPLGLLFIAPGLFLSQVAEDKPLFYLIILSAFGAIFNVLLARALALEATSYSVIFQRRLRRFHVPRFAPVVLLTLCAAGYVRTLGEYALAHHRLIQDVAGDVGVRDNVMASLLHGSFFRAPAYFGTAASNWLNIHAEYGSLAFVPLYGLRPGASTLLWLQAIIAGLAVYPLYFATSARLGRGTALWICLAYLLVAPQHGALIAGFSWLPAVTLFSYSLYYAIHSQRRALIVLSLIGLLCMSEAGPLNALGLGLTLLFSRNKPRIGLGLILVALPVLVIDLALSQRATLMLETSPLFTALTALLKNPVYFAWDLARAAKVAAMLHQLAPLCLVPVLNFECWPLLIPGLLYTSAGAQFWPNGSSNYMDSVVWVPGCFIALVHVLDKRRREGRGRARYTALLVTLSITLVSHSYNFGAFLRAEGFGGMSGSVVRMTAWGQSRYDHLRAVLERIPPNASVGVTTFLLSHVSNRRLVYDFIRPTGNLDYILVSSREASSVQGALATVFETHQYKLIMTTFDEFYLFARGAEDSGTRLALTKLGLQRPD